MEVDSAIRVKQGCTASLREFLGRLAMERRKVATAAAAALAMAVAFHVVFGANGLTAYQQKRQEAQQLKQQMQDLQHENDLLSEHVSRLQSDPNAIEHQARESTLYPPNEVIYTLPGK